MAEEERASLGQVKRIIKRKLAKQAEHEHQGINIYPMMDMMTILLVFMVMQFASSTASAVTASEEMQIPYSTSQEEMGDAVAIQISRSSIVVDGEQVVELRGDGLVDAADKQNGGSGFKIIPLHRQMQDIRQQQMQLNQALNRGEWEGEVMIIADHRTPFRTLSEVLYTVGQSGFKNLRFVAGRTSTIGGPPARE